MSATELHIDHGVGTITLNEPDNRNALSETLVGSLRADLQRCVDDPQVRVIVVTNTGRVFCAGADLKDRSARPSGSQDVSGSNAMVDLMLEIRRCVKPTIARIDGHCAGGGVGLAAAFDVSVARSDVTFGFTEVRLGVAPAIISVVCLPKMRPADAQELMLRGNRFSADRAAEVGLINFSVSTEALDGVVDELAGDVAKGGPNALTATKELIARVPQLPIDDAFSEMAVLSAALFDTDEARAGMAAFLAKEPAPWVPGDNSELNPAEAAAQQMVEHVDADGNVVEVVTRAEIRERALRHRSVYVVVESPDGEVLVHKRADWKDVWPGAWDIAFGGICDPGEAWDDAANRELWEEAGARADLVDCGELSYEAPGVAVLGRLFRATTTGPFAFNDGEVTATQWVARAELADFVAANPVPEDSAAVVLPMILERNPDSENR